MPAISATTLVWFRADLRLGDQPALAAALARGGPVVPVFILDEEGEGDWRFGAASRWWLHHSLAALDADLRARGSRLVLRRGRSGDVLGQLAAETGAGAVYWNRRYEPAVIARDTALKSGLVAAGVDARSFNGSLLFEPTAVRNQSGRPFQVFTPFWRHCQTLEVEAPRAAPAALPAPDRWPAGEALASWELLPRLDWAADFPRHWTPGEAGARRRLEHFLHAALDAYDRGRDRPASDGTGRLSPHLRWGELSPRQIWAAVMDVSRESGVMPRSRGAFVFLSEVGWREFAYHLLYHFPQTPHEALRAEYREFPAQPDAALLHAWQTGRTGYPIVDAGMRQLWRTGWMHNRVRMIAASLLVKHLLQPWRAGAAWFWDTLVDADLANNTLGWQWSAGCGADAAPYFRIFNPTLQGAKFDPEGAYVRQWVPELARLPAEYVHQPWAAPSAVLHAAGVVLDRDYPRPVIEHAAGRQRALGALQQLRNGGR